MRKGGFDLRKSLAWAFVLLAGCTTIRPAEGAGGGRSLWALGLVRVELPDDRGLSAIDVKTLGAGWDGGPYLGWKAGNWVSADPARCQLLIIIRSAAAADNAAKVLQSLGGQEPCIADYTHSLRP